MSYFTIVFIIALILVRAEASVKQELRDGKRLKPAPRNEKNL